MSHYSKCFLILGIAATLLFSGATVTAEEESLEQRVDALVKPYLDNERVTGLTIGVVSQGEPQVFGFGKFSATDSRRPDGDTVYEIGSITKVFTGILLADAVNAGRVRLDQRADELLPEGVKIPSHEERAITLLDLATHVSGLPRMPDNFTPADRNNPYADYSVEQMFDFLKRHELSRAPGSKNEYSNLGLGLLGHILALNSNQTYEQLFIDKIAKPIGMSETTITLSEQQQASLAPPHLADGKPAANWDIPTFAGAGAIRSTVNDMLLLAQANLSPPDDSLGKAIDLAWKIHQKPLNNKDFAMGLGWHVARDGSTRWHNGETGGYHSMMLINRKINTAVVLLSNTATGEVDQLAEQIMRMLAGEKSTPRKFEKDIAVSKEVMQSYVGKYELVPGVVFTVTLKDDKLMVRLTGQPALQVFARSETEWFYKVVEASITFQLDDEGNCQSLELLQNGIRQTAKRVENGEK